MRSYNRETNKNKAFMPQIFDVGYKRSEQTSKFSSLISEKGIMVIIGYTCLCVSRINMWIKRIE